MAVSRGTKFLMGGYGTVEGPSGAQKRAQQVPAGEARRRAKGRYPGGMQVHRRTPKVADRVAQSLRSLECVDRIEVGPECATRYAGLRLGTNVAASKESWGHFSRRKSEELVGVRARPGAGTVTAARHRCELNVS
jgi:hypothetical protein